MLLRLSIATGKTLLFHYISEGKIRDFPKHISVHHCKELEPHELGDTCIGTVINSHPLRRMLVLCEARIRAEMAATPAPEGEVCLTLPSTPAFRPAMS